MNEKNETNGAILLFDFGKFVAVRRKQHVDLSNERKTAHKYNTDEQNRLAHVRLVLSAYLLI